jgi:hypothetical protein
LQKVEKIGKIKSESIYKRREYAEKGRREGGLFLKVEFIGENLIGFFLPVFIKRKSGYINKDWKNFQSN